MQLRLSTVLRIAAALGFAFAINLQAAPPVFDESSFSQIRFLEGRWKGVGPDGKEFFDEYVLAEPTLFRSIRHADGAFNEATDGSTVRIEDGVVTSTWGQFTWRATTLSASKACFEPVNAPSAFCWERVAPDALSVTHRWSGSDGEEQSYVLTLNRVTP